MIDFTGVFDSLVDNSLGWLTDHAVGAFNSLSFALSFTFKGLNGLLMFVPWWVLVLVAAAAGWLLIGRVFAVSALLGLWLCQAMGV